GNTMEKNNFASHFRNEAAYIARYSGSGVVNTIFGFFVIFIAMALGVPPVISNIVGYTVGFTSGFVLSKKFVFRSSGHFVGESIRYLVAFIVSFLFNLFVLYIALTYLEIHAVVSQIVAAVSYATLMYILTRIYVFDNEPAGVKSKAPG
ncbi:MAG: GtrA family protein, partial [Desulfopila sp.]